MKVYIVHFESYDGSYIRGVFDSFEKAKSSVTDNPLTDNPGGCGASNNIYEYEINLEKEFNVYRQEESNEWTKI